MTRVPVNPQMLRWARTRAGLDAPALAGRFPALVEWEAGARQPTLKQAEAFAKATHTPIGLLFAPVPPPEPLPIPDFRTLGAARLGPPSADLLDTIYLCQQRQDWYRDHARIQGEAAVPFVGTATPDDPVEPVAARVAEAIGFDVAERQALPTWTEALRRLIAQLEDAGALVMVSGVVGSNTRRGLDPEEFRGFALVDDLAPLIFINGADTKPAQQFTLAHELAHLLLGRSGVSDSQAVALPREQVERWCNGLAAELLAPLRAVTSAYRPDAEPSAELQRLARRFKVSTLVILRRLHDLGAMDRETFRERYRRELARLRGLERGGDGGGDFYRTLGVRVSRRFARALVASTLEGHTLFRDAYRLLGIRKAATFNEAAKTLGVR